MTVKNHRPPRYRQMIVRVPQEELQLVHDVLWHISVTDFPDTTARDMAICTFLALTEELLEEYCPPYKGGEKWDNRR